MTKIINGWKLRFQIAKGFRRLKNVVIYRTPSDDRVLDWNIKDSPGIVFKNEIL